MSIGITLLIILAIPTLLQVFIIGIKLKQQHEELIKRIDALEKNLNNQ